MPDGFSLAIPQLGLTFLITGGIIAGTYEWIRYYFNKKREDAFVMSKQKMTVVSKSLPIHIQLSSYYKSLSDDLGNPQKNTFSCIINISTIISLQNFVFQTYGSIQLDNLEAERILTQFGYYVIEIVYKELTPDDASLIQYLAKKTSYEEIVAELQKNQAFSERFTTWLSTSKSLQLAEQRCRWYSQLLTLETNHIYKLWYNEEPRFTDLDHDLREYLSKEKRNYCARLVSFETHGLM
jgi:hypothetical protein